MNLRSPGAFLDKAVMLEMKPGEYADWLTGLNTARLVEVVRKESNQSIMHCLLVDGLPVTVFEAKEEEKK